MRRLFMFACLVVLSTVMLAQSDDMLSPAQRPFVLPGKGKINVESLNKNINLNMDISQLSLCELRVLRNAFAARQGYVFSSGDLRGLFNTTTWYEGLCYDRYDFAKGNNTELKYTPKESQFIAKLKAREDELKKLNFSTTNGIVNIDNLINPYQLESMPDAMSDMLRKHGFGILEGDGDQIFQIYESNDYCMFPSFVTTDLYLQLFHLFFDTMLRKIEESRLSDVVSNLTYDMYTALRQQASQTKDAGLKAAAEWDAAFFAVAYSLITDKALPQVDAQWQQMCLDEIDKAKQYGNAFSAFLDRNEIPFEYALFRPRGHYTRSEQCGRYFRAMMWLQTVPFGTDMPNQMLRAAVIANTVAGNANVRKSYNTVDEVLLYLMGRPDNVTIMQVAEIMKSGGYTPEKLAKDKKALAAFSKEVDQLAESQVRLRPKFEYTSRNKVNFMPQRYMPDAEVLQEMVDYDNRPTKRALPSGLDVMAAFGSTAAERVLLKELKEGARWNKFVPTLDAMKKQASGFDFSVSMATRWMDALNAINNSKDGRYPYFMMTDAWGKKNLNTTLASWAELKHDAILYAKQPIGAECGGEGLPSPVVRGYVEPNITFWTKAVSLFDDTQALFRRHGLLTDDLAEACDGMQEEAKFLLQVSQKELSDKRLEDGEYDHIRYIGAAFENLSLSLLKEPDQYLMGWDDVQGTDKKMALVADVYTANADNNPVKSVLYEAVGPANEIYVIVEVEGYLYLMRGGVFSYREFSRSMDEPRLNDEEWQQMLQQYPETGKPSWMKDIIIPTDQKPLPDQRIFYSSGC